MRPARDADSASKVIPRLHHVGISVRSLDRSLAFYRDLLGFVELHDVTSHAEYLGRLLGHQGVHLRVAMVRAPADSVAIELLEYRNALQVDVDHDHANPGIAHIAVQVPDVDSVFGQLRASGIRSVSEPLTPTSGPNKGGRIVYLIDPDGVRLELIAAAGHRQDGPWRGPTGRTAAELGGQEACCDRVDL